MYTWPFGWLTASLLKHRTTNKTKHDTEIIIDTLFALALNSLSALFSMSWIENRFRVPCVILSCQKLLVILLQGIKSNTLNHFCQDCVPLKHDITLISIPNVHGDLFKNLPGGTMLCWAVKQCYGFWYSDPNTYQAAISIY